MPLTDRTQADQGQHAKADLDLGHTAKTSQSLPADDFLAIGPALCILRLRRTHLLDRKPRWNRLENFKTRVLGT